MAPGVLGLERNHFDRVTHLAFGLFLTYPLFELFLRLTGARRPLLLYLTFMTQLGLAGAWEIIESVVAQVTRPDLGAAFLGAQGDPWDAQHDMLAATCGTVIALLLTVTWPALARRGRALSPRRPWRRLERRSSGSTRGTPFAWVTALSPGAPSCARAGSPS